MTRLTRLLAVVSAGLALSAPRASIAQAAAPQFEYLSPLPGSTLILPETNIILRPGGSIDPASVVASLVSVSGSVSGSHEGRLHLSDDGQTITFQPDTPFAFGEEVTCGVGPGLSTDTRGAVAPGSFTFTITGPEVATLGDSPVPADYDEFAPSVGAAAPRPAALQSAALATDSLPADFPNIRASVYGPTAPGRLFVGDLRFGSPVSSYLMILENDGTPFFYRALRGPSLDFKMQPDGRLTYFSSADGIFYALNAHYDVVDSFRCGNGYSTDAHDLIVLPSGHALLMSYDRQVMDLSQIVPGGLPDARVVGLVLQELDRDKNVVFQWRSWDHFQITDAVHLNFTAKTVDYVHCNSIDVDPSGNPIISSRHLDEITKINRATGDIIWRMGGKNNQFAFVNEPIAFTYQHCARLLPNGNLILFDNGNFHPIPFSRAVEYAIDEAQKTATRVWQFRMSPDVFGFAAGSVQRFANGNTLIGWGITNPTLTEVAADGTLLSELTFDPGVATYRAFRFEWPPVRPATIALNPATLTEGSLADWIGARIQSDAGDFLVSDIEIPTVRLNGTIPADSATAKLGDSNGDGKPDLKVRFARRAVVPLLTSGLNRVEVSGSLKTGEIFRGFADMNLFPALRGRQLAGSLQAISKPGALPLVLAIGRGVRHTTALAVFDVQGRLVTRLRARAGAEEYVTWDGRAADGRRVGSGIYFISPVGGERESPLKVVIAR